MKNFKSFLLIFAFLFFTVQSVLAQNVWVNDSRDLFLKHELQIYEINIRTFNAQDINDNGIIDFDDGEESGNFLNGIQRLDELAEKGINTIHILPIMQLGKTKALGTAGSLYAPVSFTKLNPQLGSNKTALSLESQAIKFINEAHKRRIRVIVDLPSCGSYDLFLQRPDLFVKDKSGQGIVPADWTDVRLFDAGTESNINKNVYNLYKDYVDYVIKLGVDGIRADVATSKPANFWKELITYSRTKDPQFLWIAEASEIWNEPISSYAVFTPYNKLLEVGFDGYYGKFMDFKNIKSAKDFMNYIKYVMELKTKYVIPKSVIGSFATHDEMNPTLENGMAYTDMIFWLNAVLPINSYMVDGIPSGDNFVYFWANKKATKTYTDDDFYFAHRGKMDIFNFSRMPGGKNTRLESSFVTSNRIKYSITNIYNAPDFKFTELRTSSPSVFGFTLSGNDTTIIVYGNISKMPLNDIKIYIPDFEDKDNTIPIKINSIPIASKGKMTTRLMPYELQIMLVGNFKEK